MFLQLATGIITRLGANGLLHLRTGVVVNIGFQQHIHLGTNLGLDFGFELGAQFSLRQGELLLLADRCGFGVGTCDGQGLGFDFNFRPCRGKSLGFGFRLGAGFGQGTLRLGTLRLLLLGHTRAGGRHVGAILGFFGDAGFQLRS